MRSPKQIATSKRVFLALGVTILGLLTFGVGCGGGTDLAQRSLTLHFDPKVMPEDTFRLTVYVLPSIVTVNGQDEGISCDLFVGPTADKTIYDYSAHLVSTPKQVLFNPAEGAAVAIDDLPPGLLIFLVEALDADSNPLALGCGKGQIDRGEKTFITIYMESY